MGSGCCRHHPRRWGSPEKGAAAWPARALLRLLPTPNITSHHKRAHMHCKNAGQNQGSSQTGEASSHPLTRSTPLPPLTAPYPEVPPGHAAASSSHRPIMPHWTPTGPPLPPSPSPSPRLPHLVHASTEGSDGAHLLLAVADAGPWTGKRPLGPHECVQHLRGQMARVAPWNTPLSCPPTPQTTTTTTNKPIWIYTYPQRAQADTRTAECK